MGKGAGESEWVTRASDCCAALREAQPGQGEPQSKECTLDGRSPPPRSLIGQKQPRGPGPCTVDPIGARGVTAADFGFQVAEAGVSSDPPQTPSWGGFEVQHVDLVYFLFIHNYSKFFDIMNGGVSSYVI